MDIKNKLGDMKRNLKSFSSSKAALKKLTGCESFDDIKWAFDSLSKDEQEGCADIVRKMRLKNPHGGWLWAFLVVKGRMYEDAMKRTGGKGYAKFDEQLNKATEKLAKKLKM